LFKGAGSCLTSRIHAVTGTRVASSIPTILTFIIDMVIGTLASAPSTLAL
jgi:hypothetical protein